MEEIKAIYKKYDIGGFTMLHTPGFGEFHSEISPSFSCMYWEMIAGQQAIRFRAKLEDYGGDKEARNKKITDTVDLVNGLAMCLGKHAMVYMNLMDELEKK